MDYKVAVVTGASSGVGRASAIALSNAGWKVVLTGRRLHMLHETEHSCVPGSAFVFSGDITDENFVVNLFKATIDHFGRLDLLFNNAGVSTPPIPLENVSLKWFQTVMTVNVIGPFLCTREAMKIFKAQTPQGGRIINNASLSAHTPRPHTSSYSCSKHAVSGLTKCTALDGRPFGITCTQIDIGNAHTDATAGIENGILQPDGRVIPEQTFDVNHVGSSIVHIASLPNDVAILEFIIMAARAPFVGRG